MSLASDVYSQAPKGRPVTVVVGLDPSGQPAIQDVLGVNGSKLLELWDACKPGLTWNWTKVGPVPAIDPSLVEIPLWAKRQGIRFTNKA